MWLVQNTKHGTCCDSLPQGGVAPVRLRGSVTLRGQPGACSGQGRSPQSHQREASLKRQKEGKTRGDHKQMEGL